MAGGVFVNDVNVNDGDGKLTMSVILTCLVAASGGLLFGYDIGISGGVTTMEPFLKKFFPSVLRKKADASQDEYCVFDSQVLTAFTSSLYIAGLVASLIAGRLTAATGRKGTMIIGGLIFLIGTAFNACAVNVGMLIFGRILLGFGIGFTNQATPVYLSEMAPPKWRGAFNTGFQFFISLGVVAATFINFGAAQIGDMGWRLALGLGAVPAIILVIGAFFIPDTPSSLIGRGMVQQARISLHQVRGVDSDVETELNDLVSSIEASKAVIHEPFKKLFRRQYRPHLVLTAAIPFFQQLTGINVIAFYAPVIFQSIGFGSNTALIGAIILGVVNLASVLVSTYMVDRCGRRLLFLEGGIQMIICQVALACILATKTETSGDEPFSKSSAILILVLMCAIATAFGWSWGPLTWLVPSEILPMEVRPAGQGICIAVNFLVTFVLAQTFLSMLCHMKSAAFLFYAAWIIVMTIFVALFLPETKGIPLDSMDRVWQQHWYWNRFFKWAPFTNLPIEMH